MKNCKWLIFISNILFAAYVVFLLKEKYIGWILVFIILFLINHIITFGVSWKMAQVETLNKVNRK